MAPHESFVASYDFLSVALWLCENPKFLTRFDHQSGSGPIFSYAKWISYGVARTVIYTTKVHCLNHNVHALDVARPIMIVGRYGLPVSAYLNHLYAPPVGTRCCFLGDADPPDILAFAWLREHVAMGWLGVDDNLLIQSPDSDLASLEIAMSESEKQTMRLLPDLFSDFRDLLGPRCSGALDRGFKIELEAAMISLGSWPKTEAGQNQRVDRSTQSRGN